MKRLFRLAAVVVGALALVASTQPAQAITWRKFIIQGTARLSGPLGYPVLNGTPQVPPSTSGHPNCLPPLPTLPGQPTLTLGDVWDNVPLTNCHLHWGGNTRAFGGFLTSTCLNLGLNITKPNKAPAHAGPCTIALVENPLNTVSGFCGLNGGQSVQAITDALGQTFTADIHFSWFQSDIVLTGHWTKVGSAQRGLIIGVLDALPQLPVVGNSESCVNKTAVSFDISGAIWLLPV